jgi:hypothetical protein
MPFVQAHKRNKTYIHTFPDMKLVFEPNSKGDVVCDVQEPSAVERLLLTPTGFRLYGEQIGFGLSPVLTTPAAQTPAVAELAGKPVATEEAESPYVLRSEGSEDVLDLRPLSDAELFAFAEANGIKVSPKAKGDTIRDKIVEFLSTEE